MPRRRRVCGLTAHGPWPPTSRGRSSLARHQFSQAADALRAGRSERLPAVAPRRRQPRVRRGPHGLGRGASTRSRACRGARSGSYVTPDAAARRGLPRRGFRLARRRRSPGQARRRALSQAHRRDRRRRGPRRRDARERPPASTMALHDPVVLQRPGLIVLAHRWARDRADEALSAARRAPPGSGPGYRHAARRPDHGHGLGRGRPRRPGVQAPRPPRFVPFSYPSLRVADKDRPTDHVAVMGPAPAGPRDSRRKTR